MANKPPPKIIAVTGMKGGVGKTTVAVNLAATLQARGRRVLLVDADIQQTASIWVQIARESEAPVPTLITNSAANLHQREQLPRLASQFDHVIIDGPPRLADVQQSILMVADLVLYPCGPSGPEVWALRPGLEELGRVQRAQRPDLQAAIVLNRTQQTTQSKNARESLEAALRTLQDEIGLRPVPILQSTLGFRVAQSEAMSAGQGVVLYQPGSTAAEEVDALVSEILTLKEAPHASTKARPRGPVASERRPAR